MTEDEIQFTEELLYELKRINPVAHDKLKHVLNGWIYSHGFLVGESF